MDYPAFDPNGLTELPFNLPGHIYRSAMPFRPEDLQEALFPKFQAHNISTVVMLVEEGEAHQKTGRDLVLFYRSQGLAVIQCPIPDFNVPGRETIDTALQAVISQAQAGKNIAVHCYAGIGRTGTFVACLARKLLGFSSTQAVAWVRNYIPNAMENLVQVQFVMEFES